MSAENEEISWGRRRGEGSKDLEFHSGAKMSPMTPGGDFHGYLGEIVF